MERSLQKQKTPPKFRLTRAKIERGAILIFISLTALLAGIASFVIARQITQSGFSSIIAPIFGGESVGASPEESNLAPGDEIPINNESVQSAIPANLTPWDGAGRVTILILGLDYRDWSSREKASRSDTMILLTLDPITKTAGMLSIPRDMWVSIPGFDHGKINTAHFLGQAYDLPGGGPGLAVKTVEEFLGVPINYYAQIDFGAFVRFIDEIGGVKVDIPERITVDLIGDGAETKKTLKPGVQVLPGEWALAYARNRSTGGGDFDRAIRQQQVILGIRDRVLSVDALPTLIAKAPTLFRELAAGINTNLGLEDAIKLALLAQEVEDENIVRGALNEEHVLFGRSQDNLSILIPLPDKIQIVRDQVFASTSGLSPETPGDPSQQMQAENASLFILNTTQNPGLKDQTAAYLRSLGVKVHSVQDGGTTIGTTKIVDRTGNPYLVNFLVDLMNIPNGSIYIDFDPTSEFDVEIHLGNDWAASNPMP